MLTSIKRLLIVITAIIAVSAPSVASARFFDYGPSMKFLTSGQANPVAVTTAGVTHASRHLRADR